MWKSARCLHRCLAARLAPPRLGVRHPVRLPLVQATHLAGARWDAPSARRWDSVVRGAAAVGQAPADGEWEEVEYELPSHCAGCGVQLQDESAEKPGYFQVPKKIIDLLSSGAVDGVEEVSDDEGEEGEEHAEEAGPSGRDASTNADEDAWGQVDAHVESWLDDEPSHTRRVEVRNYEDAAAEESILGDVLCARCYSLRHYGRVKSAEAEAALPAFDFGRKVGRRIALQKFRRSVVLVVVDLADFDGSLPRAAVRSLLQPEEREGDISRRVPRTFRLVVAANKADLLPSAASKLRLEAWVRRRMAQGGLPRASAIHIVSSERGSGVKELLAELQDAVGTRGDVWVAGAQNAGKSSLINAMRRAAGLSEGRNVTQAPLPGTTLDVVSVPSMLPRGCKMLDTPGVPHPFQLAKFLTADEMRMVLPKRSLKPRTYRIGTGQTVLLGALARVDVLQSPGATLYLTVWASDDVDTHLGRTEGAADRYTTHAGSKLTPPVGGEERMASFPALVPTNIEVVGDSWRESSMDVAVAGLGWVAVGVSGTAGLRVWAPPGVAVTTRDALLPDFAKELERPGFSDATKAARVAAPKRRGGGKPPKSRRRLSSAA